MVFGVLHMQDNGVGIFTQEAMHTFVKLLASTYTILVWNWSKCLICFPGDAAGHVSIAEFLN